MWVSILTFSQWSALSVVRSLSESHVVYVCVTAKPQTRERERKKMAKQVRFNDKVSQAVFDKSKGSKRCIDNVESCPLAEEDEVAAHTSEFQLLQREQNKSLHEYHVNKRKRSRLHMGDDILEIFWTTYEQEAWKRLNDILDSPITTEDVNTFAVEAITSVNKNEIVKR